MGCMTDIEQAVLAAPHLTLYTQPLTEINVKP